MINGKQISTKKSYNILLLDDHPVIVEALINMIDFCKKKDEIFNYIKVLDCEGVVKKLYSLKLENNNLDIAFIDISLKPYKNLKSGADVIKLIKQLFPNCKLVITTALTEPILIYNLIQEVDIDIILCKNDITNYDFPQVFNLIISGKHHRSNTVQKELIKITQAKFGIDDIDLNIIYCISKKIKTKDLPLHIPLSLSAIEKRKSYLKKHFSNNKEDLNFFLSNLKKAGLL